jgi:hypothetical protein
MTITLETLLEATDLPNNVRRETPRLINRLLGQTFLYQDKETDKDDYYLMYRHRAVFEALFALSASPCATMITTASFRSSPILAPAASASNWMNR